MARRLISLPEAAGTPEGGKVLGRGSAPMGAVLATGPDDAEQAAGVELAQVYRCFVPVQETHTKAAGRACCGFARGGATRAVTRERKTSEGALEIYITKYPCKNCQGDAPRARLQGSN